MASKAELQAKYDYRVVYVPVAVTVRVPKGCDHDTVTTPAAEYVERLLRCEVAVAGVLGAAMDDSVTWETEDDQGWYSDPEWERMERPGDHQH